MTNFSDADPVILPNVLLAARAAKKCCFTLLHEESYGDLSRQSAQGR